jgi:hypothetical protein
MKFKSTVEDIKHASRICRIKQLFSVSTFLLDGLPHRKISVLILRDGCSARNIEQYFVTSLQVRGRKTAGDNCSACVWYYQLKTADCNTQCALFSATPQSVFFMLRSTSVTDGAIRSRQRPPPETLKCLTISILLQRVTQTKY